MRDILLFFLYFITYSFLGWLIETVYTSIYYHRVTNRGYLLGPLCPIYGFGSVFAILLVGTSEPDLFTMFLKSVFVAAVLEYFTSFLMEKLFKTRWWDYSRLRFNINGRICLETMVPFGLLSILLLRFVHPFVSSVFTNLPNAAIISISSVIFALYLTDNIISYIVMGKIRNKIKKTARREDSTEEIKRLMYAWLGKHSILFRRLGNAYPGFLIANFKKSRRTKTRPPCPEKLRKPRKQKKGQQNV